MVLFISVLRLANISIEFGVCRRNLYEMYHSCIYHFYLVFVQSAYFGSRIQRCITQRKSERLVRYDSDIILAKLIWNRYVKEIILIYCRVRDGTRWYPENRSDMDKIWCGYYLNIDKYHFILHLWQIHTKSSPGTYTFDISRSSI